MSPIGASGCAYSSVGGVASVSRASHGSGTSVPRESAAHATAVAHLADVRSHPVCSYVLVPYERTFSPSYNVRLCFELHILMTLYSMCLFSLVPFIFILLSHFFKKNIK